MRVNNGCSLLMNDLECRLLSVFLPALFGAEVTVAERQLFGLPLKYGGLGIISPVANHCFDTSIGSTTFLCKSILGTASFELDGHVHCAQSAKALNAQVASGYFTTLFNNLIGQFNPCQQHAILQAKACNSSWLSVVPLAAHQFDLTCQEFRDALALQYRKPLLNLPPYCDGCGAPFSVDHALDCRVGDLVGWLHSEVWDAIGDLASLVRGQFQREPVICEETADGSCNETLVGNLRIRGVWQSQADAVFDVCVYRCTFLQIEVT